MESRMYVNHRFRDFQKCPVRWHNTIIQLVETVLSRIYDSVTVQPLQCAARNFDMQDKRKVGIPCTLLWNAVSSQMLLAYTNITVPLTYFYWNNATLAIVEKMFKNVDRIKHNWRCVCVFGLGVYQSNDKASNL